MSVWPRIVDVSLVPDPAILAAGDVIADTALFSVFGGIDFGAILDSLLIVDESTQGAALSVIFFNTSTGLGPPNSAPNISAVNAGNILGQVSFLTTDYVNVGNARIAVKGNLGIILKPVAGTQQIGVALLNGAGTPTYGVTIVKLRLGIRG